MKQLIFVSTSILFLMLLTSCNKKPTVLRLSTPAIHIHVNGASSNAPYQIAGISDPLTSAEVINICKNLYKKSKVKRDIIVEWNDNVPPDDTKLHEELKKISKKYSIKVVYLPHPIGSDPSSELNQEYEKLKKK